MNNKDLKSIILMGIFHALVSFTSITVVTTILGFNLPVAFLFAGIGTLIFHFLTQNKLPMVLGVSGLYIGSLLYVTQTWGMAYAFGGIIFAGGIYIVFALAMLYNQEKILKLFPNWLLSTAVMLIGLSLLPIGQGLVAGNLLVGIVAFIVTAMVDLLGKDKLAMFAMPVGVLAGTIVCLLTGGLTSTIAASSLVLTFVAPKFALAPILCIAPLAFAVLLEALGDAKNTSSIIGIDVFKEVGMGRVLFGNGLATMLSGVFGGNAYTTYAENAAFIMLSKFYNPWAQVITSVLFIILAFIPGLYLAISYIPMAAFGGVITYLFAMIVVNAIKQLFKDEHGILEDKYKFIIITIMVGISFIQFTISGVLISSVAIAILSGVIINIIYTKFSKKEEKNNVESGAIE